MNLKNLETLLGHKRNEESPSAKEQTHKNGSVNDMLKKSALITRIIDNNDKIAQSTFREDIENIKFEPINSRTYHKFFQAIGMVFQNINEADDQEKEKTKELKLKYKYKPQIEEYFEPFADNYSSVADLVYKKPEPINVENQQFVYFSTNEEPVFSNFFETALNSDCTDEDSLRRMLKLYCLTDCVDFDSNLLHAIWHYKAKYFDLCSCWLFHENLRRNRTEERLEQLTNQILKLAETDINICVLNNAENWWQFISNIPVVSGRVAKHLSFAAKTIDEADYESFRTNGSFPRQLKIFKQVKERLTDLTDKSDLLNELLELTHIENWKIMNMAINFAYMQFYTEFATRINENAIYEFKRLIGTTSENEIYIKKQTGLFLFICKKNPIGFFRLIPETFSKSNDTVRKTLEKTMRNFKNDVPASEIAEFIKNCDANCISIVVYLLNNFTINIERLKTDIIRFLNSFREVRLVTAALRWLSWSEVEYHNLLDELLDEIRSHPDSTESTLAKEVISKFDRFDDEEVVKVNNGNLVACLYLYKRRKEKNFQDRLKVAFKLAEKVSGEAVKSFLEIVNAKVSSDLPYVYKYMLRYMKEHSHVIKSEFKKVMEDENNEKRMKGSTLTGIIKEFSLDQ